jgi:hypothetical protein
MSAPKLVQIEWVDSRQPAAAWQRVSDLGYLSECRCITAGFLLRQDKNVTVIALSVADDGNEMQAAGVFVIPTPAVTSLHPLVTASASVCSGPASKPKRRRTSRAP